MASRSTGLGRSGLSSSSTVPTQMTLDASDNDESVVPLGQLTQTQELVDDGSPSDSDGNSPTKKKAKTTSPKSCQQIYLEKNNCKQCFQSWSERVESTIESHQLNRHYHHHADSSCLRVEDKKLTKTTRNSKL